MSPQETALDDSESAVLRILGDGLQKASEEVVSKYGDRLLQQILPVALSSLGGPVAAGAAALVAAIVENVFKQTNSTDRKLDKLLAKPFRTATRIIQDVLSEEVKSDAEEAEARRRLENAANQLEEAFTHAENDLPEKRLLVQVYQLFVAALLEGGGAAMRKHEGDLLRLANAAEAESKRLIGAANRALKREDGIVAEAMETWRLSSGTFAPPTRRELTFPMGLPSSENIQDFIDARVSRYRQDATNLEKNAKDLRNLCAFMEKVHESRGEILRAPKRKGFLEKIWREFLPKKKPD
jgi:hypothetical protein